MNLQSFELITLAKLTRNAKRILFILPQLATVDAYASAIVLSLLYAKEGKRIACVTSGDVASFSTWSPFTKIVKTNPEKISDVDLIVVCGTTDVRELGDVWIQHEKQFEPVPLVFLSSQPRVRQVPVGLDILDPDASSLCEVVHNLVCALHGETNLDKDMALHLLAGLVSETRLFQDMKVRAGSIFLLASKLFALIPESYQQIVTSIYKTHSLEQIVFWGLILERIVRIGTGVISVVKEEEIQKLGVCFEDAYGVFFDIFATSQAEFRVIACESQGTTKLYIASTRPLFSVEDVFESFSYHKISPIRLDVSAPVSQISRHLQQYFSDKKISPLKKFAQVLLQT